MDRKIGSFYSSIGRSANFVNASVKLRPKHDKWLRHNAGV